MFRIPRVVVRRSEADRLLAMRAPLLKSLSIFYHLAVVGTLLLFLT